MPFLSTTLRPVPGSQERCKVWCLSPLKIFGSFIRPTLSIGWPIFFFATHVCSTSHWLHVITPTFLYTHPRLYVSKEIGSCSPSLTGIFVNTEASGIACSVNHYMFTHWIITAHLIQNQSFSNHPIEEILDRPHHDPRFNWIQFVRATSLVQQSLRQ